MVFFYPLVKKELIHFFLSGKMMPIIFTGWTRTACFGDFEALYVIDNKVLGKLCSKLVAGAKMDYYYGTLCQITGSKNNKHIAGHLKG
jgi:hypothetical protein